MSNAGIDKEQVTAIYKEALKAAQFIVGSGEDAEWRKVSVRLDIANGMAHAGIEKGEVMAVFEEALTFAKAREPQKRSSAIGIVARDLAYAGFYKEALDIERTHKDNWEQTQILKEILNNGDSEDITKPMIKEYLHAELQSDRSDRSANLTYALNDILKSKADRDLVEWAYKEALNATQAKKHMSSKSYTLRTIVEAMSNGGLYKEGLDAARTIANPLQRSYAFYSIANSMSKSDIDIDKTKVVYKEAQAAARMVADMEYRAKALQCVVLGMVESGMLYSMNTLA
jgi:hypothetical protein